MHCAPPHLSVVHQEIGEECDPDEDEHASGDVSGVTHLSGRGGGGEGKSAVKPRRERGEGEIDVQPESVREGGGAQLTATIIYFVRRL